MSDEGDVRIVVVRAVEVSGTHPFMRPGSLSVMLAVICFTAAALASRTASPIYERATAISRFKM